MKHDKEKFDFKVFGQAIKEAREAKEYSGNALADCAASSLPDMHETALKFMKTRFRVFNAEEIMKIWRQEK